MNEITVSFVNDLISNLFATFLGVLLAFWVERRWEARKVRIAKEEENQRLAQKQRYLLDNMYRHLSGVNSEYIQPFSQYIPDIQRLEEIIREYQKESWRDEYRFSLEDPEGNYPDVQAITDRQNEEWEATKPQADEITEKILSYFPKRVEYLFEDNGFSETLLGYKLNLTDIGEKSLTIELIENSISSIAPLNKYVVITNSIPNKLHDAKELNDDSWFYEPIELSHAIIPWLPQVIVEFNRLYSHVEERVDELGGPIMDDSKG